MKSNRLELKSQKQPSSLTHVFVWQTKWEVQFSQNDWRSLEFIAFCVTVNKLQRKLTEPCSILSWLVFENSNSATVSLFKVLKFFRKNKIGDVFFEAGHNWSDLHQTWHFGLTLMEMGSVRKAWKQEKKTKPKHFWIFRGHCLERFSVEKLVRRHLTRGQKRVKRTFLLHSKQMHKLNYLRWWANRRSWFRRVFYDNLKLPNFPICLNLNENFQNLCAKSKSTVSKSTEKD